MAETKIRFYVLVISLKNRKIETISKLKSDGDSSLFLLQCQLFYVMEDIVTQILITNLNFNQYI
ncbi:MAG: hypothetical protein APR54_11375 [Candidatus Cloacimonas sp. SDB]|nr:MAG: hypothetical protein APR54_11375 [Candidatus Cloacimonas sp. SDB]